MTRIICENAPSNGDGVVPGQTNLPDAQSGSPIVIRIEWNTEIMNV